MAHAFDFSWRQIIFVGLAVCGICAPGAAEFEAGSPTISRFEAIQATTKADRWYQHGRGQREHYPEARRLFKLGADAGIREAQFYYARMNQYGHGGPVNFDNAWAYYQAAADQNDRRALNNLGYMLANGQGREVDASAAHRYYLESAYCGMPMAMYNVAQNFRLGRGVDEPDWKTAVGWYELYLKAYPRYGPAWNNLGRMLSRGGHGIEADPLAAFDCFVRADVFGDANGAYNLGRRFRDGVGGLPVNRSRAEDAFVRAANRGHSNGWKAAGDLYFYPRRSLLPERAEKARHYYDLAVKTGSFEALDELAYLLRFGPDNVRDLDSAIPLLKRCAEEQASRWANRVLGECYEKGLGVEIDPMMAIDHYRNGAELGDGICALRLGAALVRGNHVGRDFEEARKWLELALEERQIEAVDDLGFLYENGKGVERDLERAAEYYRIGVEQGFSYSLVSLGLFHLRGLIENANPQHGVSLIERAANRGYPSAVAWMVRIYREGLGGREPDPTVAEAWQRKASD